MKTKKKHSFTHLDPERIGQEEADRTSKKKPGTKLNQRLIFPQFLYSDLKRTGVIIGIFLGILLVLYFVIQKTHYLDSVLRVFKLV